MNKNIFTDIKRDVQESIVAEWDIDDIIESAVDILICYLQDNLSEKSLDEVKDVLYDQSSCCNSLKEDLNK